jgi:hypothetical protein
MTRRPIVRSAGRPLPPDVLPDVSALLAKRPDLAGIGVADVLDAVARDGA